MGTGFRHQNVGDTEQINRLFVFLALIVYYNNAFSRDFFWESAAASLRVGFYIILLNNFVALPGPLPSSRGDRAARLGVCLENIWRVV